MNPPDTTAQPRRLLNLFDSTCIIVGIIIGAGIYKSTPIVANCVSGPVWMILVWVAGGALSLLGALCYAELVSGHPADGGDYVFLTKAFGRPLGFLFAWAQFWVVRPGSIGAMAYVFAAYANEILPLRGFSYPQVAYAAGAICVLTASNIVGVKQGKWVQNILTVAKVVGLLSVFVVAMCSSGDSAKTAPAGDQSWNISLAMILVLFTYGGWNDVAYVGGEVRDPRRNVIRALLLGVAGVTTIYVLLNLAFLWVLGFAGVRSSGAVAADTLRVVLGDAGAGLVSGLVCVSALGAMNGMIFTGARIYSAFGNDHAFYAPLGKWNPRLQTPVTSLLTQCLVTVAVVVAFGTPLLGNPAQTSQGVNSQAGFERLVNFTAPAFWFFILMAAISLFVLRGAEPGDPGRFRVPLFPVVPALFCCSSLFMVYSSVNYAIQKRSPEAFWSIGLFALGLLLSFFSPRPS